MSSDEDVRIIATIARRDELRIAVAESLTCGALTSALGRGDKASTWLAGGVVAYVNEAKFAVLGVDEGPVITASCARQMADGVQRLLHSDVTLAVTGVGGPDPEEGKAAGTVFIATRVRGNLRVDEHLFEGDPGEVLNQTVTVALSQTAREMQRASDSRTTRR